MNNRTGVSAVNEDSPRQARMQSHQEIGSLCSISHKNRGARPEVAGALASGPSHGLCPIERSISISFHPQKRACRQRLSGDAPGQQPARLISHTLPGSLSAESVAERGPAQRQAFQPGLEMWPHLGEIQERRGSE